MPDVAIIVLFYLHNCYSVYALFTARKEASTTTIQTKPFPLSTKSAIFLGFLGVLSCVFAYGIFEFGVARFEMQYREEWTHDAVKIGIVHFILLGVTIIAVAVGSRLIVSGAVKTGQVVIPRRHSISQPVPCIRWFQTYQLKTRPRGGEWFFIKMLFWESFEITLQIASLHEFAASKSSMYVLLSSVTILINMVATPVLFYNSATASSTSVSFYNGLILLVDTLIDTAYFGTNLYYLLPSDLYKNHIFGTAALAWPVFCVMMRLRSLSRLVMVRYKSAPVAHQPETSRISSTVLSFSHAQQGRYVWHTLAQNSKLASVIGVLSCIAVFATVQLTCVVWAIVQTNHQCASELGPALWEGASPKYIFRNGLFGVPVCAYENITHIHAPGKHISSLSGVVAQCTSLETLNLTRNALVALPREVLLMGGALTRVDLTRNKVATRLVARNMSLRGGLPIFVVRHLSKTLEELDLSNNCIDRIDDTIENFHKLARFDVRNNCLGPKGLAWEITNLDTKNLQFLVSGNVLASHVHWAHQPGFQSSSTSTTVLNNAIALLTGPFEISIRKLNLSHNAFERQHFDAIATTLGNLEMLDVSYNLELHTPP